MVKVECGGDPESGIGLKFYQSTISLIQFHALQYLKVAETIINLFQAMW